MFDAHFEVNDADPSGIAKHEVSEDGVTWRPYDPQSDRHRLLHTRIEFAAED
jgi:hypothetical protein